MDPHLRRYLEQPAPRPPLLDDRYDERRWRWLAPLGACLTGGAVFAGVIGDRPEAWPYGLGAWVALVAIAAWLGRVIVGSTQTLFRTGTLATARVVGAEVVQEGEDRLLAVDFSVQLSGPAQGYRDDGLTHLPYRARLSDRWLGGDDHAPFQTGAEFPVLVRVDRRAALVFVGDETVEAGRSQA